MLSPTDARLDLGRAIDYAGPTLYGPDWIGRLSPGDIEVLTKHGPQPYGQPSQAIQPCPSRVAVRLDRAIGRDARMAVQRATVLSWILTARVMTSRGYCDREALDRALAQNRTLPTRGRPVTKRDRVLREMLDQIQTGQTTAAKLANEKQDTLARRHHASRKVCEIARKMALSEPARHTTPLN